MSVEIHDAYFAGLFDGEGSISISTLHRKSGDYCRLIVSVQMVDREAVYAFYNRFGGCIYDFDAKPGKMAYYQWYVQGSDIVEFLHAIQPYSITKREHIKIALEFATTVSKKNGGNGKGEAFKNSGIPEKRLELRDAMRLLNIKSPYRTKET